MSCNAPEMFGETPNITGWFYRKGETNNDGYSGPFERGAVNQDYGSHPDIIDCANVNFDASMASGIYSGVSVQPKALQVLACIRI